jgi:hypothetical protein
MYLLDVICGGIPGDLYEHHMHACADPVGRFLYQLVQ